MTHHSTCPYPILLVGLCSHVLIFLSLFRRSEKFWPPLFKSRLSWVMWDVNGARHTSSHFPRANTFTYPVYIEMCRSTSAQGKVNSKLKILKFVGTPIFKTYSFQCLVEHPNVLKFRFSFWNRNDLQILCFLTAMKNGRASSKLPS